MKKDRLESNQGAKGCEMKVLNKRMKGTGLYLGKVHQEGPEEEDLVTVPSVQFSYSAAAHAKSLRLCPTPCDPIDGSPPGSPVPGIL